MGQYFKPCILKTESQQTTNDKIAGWMESHDYNEGLKLMEHSWLNNEFLNTFEELISPEGPFEKHSVVWAGDYANPENDLSFTDETGKPLDLNLYDLCSDTKKLNPKRVKGNSKYRYILNHTTKQFVDKTKVPASATGTSEDGTPWTLRIHPLPLLTCEGNGNGGGDYYGEERGQVGVWARHSISVANEIPNDYSELIFDLTINLQ